MADEQAKGNFISDAYAAYKKVVPFPAASALLLGGLAWGGSRLLWRPVVNTVRSLVRVPGRALSGMSDAEWDEAFDEFEADSSYKRWVPLAFGALAAGGALYNSWDRRKEGNGLWSWTPRERAIAPAPITTTNQNAVPKAQLNPPQATQVQTPVNAVPRMKKTNSLQKQADDFFEYSGYVPNTDFSKVLDARQATSLFTNDPYLQQQDYVRNLGTSIVVNAANTAHTNKPTLGDVFDSAVNKIENKLSFEGLAHVGVRSVIANATANLFTDVLGTMTDLSPAAKRNIVDAGTWAGTISAILD